MIAAIVLAAGLSERMGKPKLLLPWGPGTVIEQVINNLVAGNIERIIVVTGSQREPIEAVLRSYPVETCFNPDFENREMLTSFQVGLQALDESIEAVLLVLGDQPQIPVKVIQELKTRYESTHHSLIVPSYQQHRGHPWLIGRVYFEELNRLRAPEHLKIFLQRHQNEINYLEVDTPVVLVDLDTPEDYKNESSNYTFQNKSIMAKKKK